MSNQWDPKTYLAFADERTRPAAERVVDLGCGPGNSTALLADRWPDAHIEGIDSSPEMIRQARESGVKAEWSVADIADWTASAPYDVVYSNAALHWVGDQASLLPRLMRSVRPGGALAFQVPLNFDMPSHVLMREVAREGSWAAKLRDVRNIVLMSAEQSFDILEPYAKALDIWETEYLQVMEGPDAVYRWVSGTGLRPFVQALDGAERDGFVEAYKARLNAAYPMRDSGKTLFPFRRLFVVARR